MAEISQITHPEYDSKVSSWKLFRLTGTGGEAFLEEYLKKRPRESNPNFTLRKEVSYIPAFAKGALQQIQNSIRQRLTAVQRLGGTNIYQDAIKGKIGGVDRRKSSMNKFIGDTVLKELIMMGAVGVYVDAPDTEQNETLLDDQDNVPFLYIFPVEAIKSWTTDPTNPTKFTRLLLSEMVQVKDEEFGLTTELVERFRFYQLEEEEVTVQFFDEAGEPVDIENQPGTQTYTVGLTEIPFVLLSLNDSLLSDIARHQIALLNLASGDMEYATESNQPFLAEQFDPRDARNYFGSVSDDPADSTAGTDENVTDPLRKPTERIIGNTRGIRVPKDIEYPKYVSPDTAPLKISMEKQKALQEEIHILINQTLQSTVSRSTSGESKKVDQSKEEDGLKAIGDELEYGESQIAIFWQMYENTGEPAEIKYPENYSFKDDIARRSEAKELSDLLAKTPSMAAQKAIAKRMMWILLGDVISDQEMQEIFTELDNAEGLISDPEMIRNLVEAQILPTSKAAVQLGFPEEVAQQAKEERLEVVAAIAKAQTPNPDARGVSEADPEPGTSARKEKRELREQGKSRKTRGENLGE